MLHTPYTVLVILIIAMALFITNVWRYDVSALFALSLAVITGVVPLDQVYSGFSNPAIITVACVMIITQAINRSGAMNWVINKLSAVTKSPTMHIASLTIISAILSSFMNNVGALAIMMPIAIHSSIKNKRSPSLVLLPIALASALGGLMTVIGTPSNLLVSSYREQTVGQPFLMFDFTYAGCFIAAIGVIFITILGWRLLPARRKPTRSVEDIFQISDYLTEIRVGNNSILNGKMLKELDTILKVEFILVGIIRNKHRRFSLSPDQLIFVDDILIIEASPKNLEEIIKVGGCDVVGHNNKNSDILQKHEIASIEATVPPGSKVIGRSATTMQLRVRHGINLLAISRQGRAFRERLHQVNFRGGDVVLLSGASENLQQNVMQLGLLPLVARHINIGKQTPRWLAFCLFIIAILLVSLQLVPVQVAFGGVVLALVMTRSIPTQLLYEGIDWPVIILLAAMIPIGKALSTSGGTSLITNLILDHSSHLPTIYIITILFIVTMTLSDFMNNAATAIVMSPIAASIAQGLHANSDPFLMTVAIAASCSFLTPVGHQNNILVMGPGGYRFTDYIRIGLPLEIIILVVAIPLLHWIWPI